MVINPQKLVKAFSGATISCAITNNLADPTEQVEVDE